MVTKWVRRIGCNPFVGAGFRRCGAPAEFPAVAPAAKALKANNDKGIEAYLVPFSGDSEGRPRGMPAKLFIHIGQAIDLKSAPGGMFGSRKSKPQPGSATGMGAQIGGQKLK